MPTIPVLKARRSIRTMRGQTRAQLIVVEDGQQYIVKYSNNPMGRRVLVNELISALLLKTLDIRTPSIAFVSLDEEVLERNPEIGVASAGTITTPPAGLHFGCQYAGSGVNPVYDFLPDKLLPEVINRNDLFGALVFDKWVSNGDFRQAIFFRENATPSGDGEPNGPWVAEMIDQDSTFQGQVWAFRDSPPQALYPRLAIYGANPTMRDCESWLEKVERLDARFFKSLTDTLPAQWIAGYEEQLSYLLSKLQERRDRLSGLVEEALVYIRAKQGHRPVAVEGGMKRLEPSEECLPG
jgi:hypothetical protein